MEDPLGTAWAVESIDFAALHHHHDDNDDDEYFLPLQKHKQQQPQDHEEEDEDDDMMWNKDASCAANTLSTAGESSSFWGSGGCCAADSHTHRSSRSMSRLDVFFDFEEEEEDTTSTTTTSQRQDDASEEHSLTMEDLRQIFQQDQMGINDLSPEDMALQNMNVDVKDLYKGDSQNSFTLEDLEEDMLLSQEEDEGEQPSHRASMRRSSTASRRRSTRWRSTRHSQMLLDDLLPLEAEQDEEDTPHLKGILKNNGVKNNGVKHNTPRRSSSMTMLLMEESGMQRLSLEDDDDDEEGFDNHEDGSLEFGWKDDSSLILSQEEDEEVGQRPGCQQRRQSSSSKKQARDQQRLSWMDQSFGLSATDCFGVALDLEDAVQEKSVRFSSVEVHYHGLLVGDNPSVTEGPPLTLDWNVQETKTFSSLEDYETNQQPHRIPLSAWEAPASSHTASLSSSSSQPRRLEAEERLFRLLNAGVSLAEIHRAETAVNRARNERDETAQQHLLLGASASLEYKRQMAFLRAVQIRDQDAHVMLPPLMWTTASSRTGTSSPTKLLTSLADL